MHELQAARRERIERLGVVKERALGDVHKFRARLDDYLPKLRHTLAFTMRLLRYSSRPQVAVFKDLLEARFRAILRCSLTDMFTPLHYAATVHTL